MIQMHSKLFYEMASLLIDKSHCKVCLPGKVNYSSNAY